MLALPMAGEDDGGQGVDPITAKLRRLVDATARDRALSCPRVRRATGKGYFLAPCPHCGDESYHHLDPHPQGPAGACERRELAWCEQCGVVESWRVLGALPDGSERVLGPDFGADGPPSSIPPENP